MENLVSSVPSQLSKKQDVRSPLKLTIFLTLSLQSLNFWLLEDHLWFSRGESTAEMVYFVCANPSAPCEVQQVRAKKDLRNNRVSAFDPKAIVKVCGQVLNPGAHYVVFCNAL